MGKTKKSTLKLNIYFMKNFLFFFIACLILTSCSMTSKTMKEPFSKIELERDDFTLSGQKTAKATSVRIVGIDFARLFNQRVGNPLPVPSIPIIGSAIYDPTSSYAMYNVMDANPGHDFIFYPQYETKTTCPILGLCFINSITTVEVTTRLGKFKEN